MGDLTAEALHAVYRMTDSERKVFLEQFAGAFCLHCGRQHPNRELGGRCHCEDDD